MYPPNRYPCLEQILCLSESNIYIYLVHPFPNLLSSSFLFARVYVYKVFLEAESISLNERNRDSLQSSIGRRGEPRAWTTMDVLTRLDGIAMASFHPSTSPFRSKENRCGDSRRCYLDEGANRKSVSTIDRVERMIRG